MLLAPIPWAGCVWALPFLTVLAPSEQWSIQQCRRHKKLTDWARQVLLQTARWLPGRRVIAVGDSSFSAIELLRDVGRPLCMISRLRLDRSEEHTSELQSRQYLVCRLLLEKKKK